MEEPVIQIGLDFSLASQEVIGILLEDTSGPGVFDEIAKANTGRPEILKLLIEHPDTPSDVSAYASGVLHLPVKAGRDIPEAERDRAKRAPKIFQKIQKLNVSGKIQLALKGGREIRGILIKDPNKEVMQSVLGNQKITDSEIEMIARSRQVPEEMLRRISKNREWVKNYAITQALVTNPKTPPGISVSLVSHLKRKDISILEKNKNVSDAVRSTAKRLMLARRQR